LVASARPSCSTVSCADFFLNVTLSSVVFHYRKYRKLDFQWNLRIQVRV
jgi:hypothetical protein